MPPRSRGNRKLLGGELLGGELLAAELGLLVLRVLLGGLRTVVVGVATHAVRELAGLGHLGPLKLVTDRSVGVFKVGAACTHRFRRDIDHDRLKLKSYVFTGGVRGPM